MSYFEISILQNLRRDLKEKQHRHRHGV